MDSRLVEYFNQLAALDAQIRILENRKDLVVSEFAEKYSPIKVGSRIRIPRRWKEKVFPVVRVEPTTPDWWIMPNVIPDVIVWSIGIKKGKGGSEYLVLVVGDKLPDYIEVVEDEH